MKTRFVSTPIALATLGVLALAPVTFSRAQETAVTTTATSADGASTSTSTQTTTSAGTIEEFTPGSSRLIVRTSTGAPMTYSYSKRTTFVDAAGNTVSYEMIKPGQPTTVYYTMEAGQPVVSKVVVTRSAPVTTATEVQAVQPVTVVTPAVPITTTDKTETTTTTTGRK